VHATRKAGRSAVSLPHCISLEGIGFSDSITLGPLADFGGSVSVGDINVFDDAFALHFGKEQVLAMA
jgi:hypothetical protein